MMTHACHHYNPNALFGEFKTTLRALWFVFSQERCLVSIHSLVPQPLLFTFWYSHKPFSNFKESVLIVSAHFLTSSSTYCLLTQYVKETLLRKPNVHIQCIRYPHNRLEIICFLLNFYVMEANGSEVMQLTLLHEWLPIGVFILIPTDINQYNILNVAWTVILISVSSPRISSTTVLHLGGDSVISCRHPWLRPWYSWYFFLIVS